MKQRHGKDRITDEQLIDAHARLGMLSKISAEFNIPEVTTWRRCKKLGITFKSGGWKKFIPTNEILEGKHPQYQTNKLRIRILKEKILENVCSECGIREHNDKPIVLHLDHINGVSKDHKLKNLRLLCPNCHSQTDTWCGKNKIIGV